MNKKRINNNKNSYTLWLHSIKVQSHLFFVLSTIKYSILLVFLLGLGMVSAKTATVPSFSVRLVEQLKGKVQQELRGISTDSTINTTANKGMLESVAPMSMATATSSTCNDFSANDNGRISLSGLTPISTTTSYDFTYSISSGTGSIDRGAPSDLNGDFIFGASFSVSLSFSVATEITIQLSSGDNTASVLGSATVDGTTENILTSTGGFQSVIFTPAINTTYTVNLAAFLGNVNLNYMTIFDASANEIAKFDFGTASSPLEAGFTRIHPGTPATTITLSSTTTSIDEKYDLVTGSSYTGSATYATATTIPSDSIVLSNITNPSGSQDFTVRIFDSAGGFVDRTVTINEVNCTPTCTGSSGVGGYVFDDENYDGVNVGETGVQGILVYVYDCAGNKVDSTFTDAGGNYSFLTTGNGGAITAGAEYRVEFELPAAFADYTPTKSGTNNGTTVQFVTEPACAYLGIFEPIECNSNTLAQNGKVLVTCSVFDGPTDVMALYDVAGLNMATVTQSPSAFTHTDWSVDWIGNVYFTEFDKEGNIYAAASLKHAHGHLDMALWQYGALGAFASGNFGDINDLGAAGTLYKMDAITGDPSVWLQLPQQADDYSGRTTGPGIGGVAYIRETDQIAVANMEDGKIYLFDASATGAGPFGILDETHAVDIFDPYNPDPGTIGMGAYSERIQGIDYYNGRLYYVSSDANLLLVGSVALNNGMFDDATERAEVSETKQDYRSVPLDIDFSTDGKMAVGAATGGGLSTNTYYDNNVPVFLYNHYAGNYVFEYSGSAWQLMDFTSVGTSSEGGVTGGNATGGVAWNDKVGATGPVNNILWMSGGDFLMANSFWGVLGNEYTAGSFVESPHIQWLFPNQFTLDFKGNGGDVDVFSCIATPTTIEIGNYIWNDSDEDGIQDACEAAIANVTVDLVKDGSVIASTMTDANGAYYFSDADGLQADSTYTVRVSNAIGGSQQAALTGMEATTSNATDANSANDDLIDSDIVMNGNNAEITVTVGSGLSINHSLDFGFFSACTNPVLTGLTNETICAGTTFDTTNVTTSVTNGITVTYQWYDNNGADNPGTNMIAGQIDSLLTALPSTAGSYSYRVAASSTTESNCTAEQTVDLVINAIPTATASITDATCTGFTANSDGTITIASFNSGERYDFTTGDSYSGSATFASGSTEIPVGGVITNTLANATQQYTVRIFSSNECFVDRLVILTQTICFVCPDVSIALNQTSVCANESFQTTISTTHGAGELSLYVSTIRYDTAQIYAGNAVLWKDTLDLGVVINEVFYANSGTADTVELYNAGTSTIDISNYQLCHLFSYGVLNSFTLVSGNLAAFAPGDRVVLSGFNLNDSASDVGLYLNNAGFGDATNMVDFMQYGSAGNGRESVAQTKGIWTAGDFVDVSSFGASSSISYDCYGEAASDWAEAVTPTFAGENGNVQTNIRASLDTTLTTAGTYYLYAALSSTNPKNMVGCQPMAIDSIVIDSCDWGDLPDISASMANGDYQTSSSNNGPVHVIISGLKLGALIDGENDGQPEILAFGDDINGDDEDGVNIFPSLNIVPGGTIRLPLTVMNTTGNIAHLEAWIDWNGDGDFDDTNEMVANYMDAADGVFPTSMDINVPTAALSGSLLGFRVRLSHTDNMTPYGKIFTGEVEDYLIGIECPQPVCLSISKEIRKE